MWEGFLKACEDYCVDPDEAITEMVTDMAADYINEEFHFSVKMPNGALCNMKIYYDEIKKVMHIMDTAEGGMSVTNAVDGAFLEMVAREGKPGGIPDRVLLYSPYDGVVSEWVWEEGFKHMDKDNDLIYESFLKEIERKSGDTNES